MKTQIKRWILCVGAALALTGTPFCHAQGFINLDFESATIVPIPGDPFGSVQFGPAFPGWSAFYNASPLSSTTPVLYNNLFLGTSTLALLDQSFSGSVISNFTAVLQGGTGASQPVVGLAQSGLVPADSRSLQFLGHTVRADNNFPETFIVSMNGQPLPFFTLQNLGNHRLYGADISAFAGQTAELRFTQFSGGALYDTLSLDNISFSTVAVPEPGTWTLLGLGGALCWCATRRRRK